MKVLQFFCGWVLYIVFLLSIMTNVRSYSNEKKEKEKEANCYQEYIDDVDNHRDRLFQVFNTKKLSYEQISMASQYYINECVRHK